MNKADLIIRLEKESEQREVENLIRESFWNVYRPGCLEHYVMHVMRNNEAFMPELNFVDETEAEEFDKNFPPKKKLKLPTQLF